MRNFVLKSDFKSKGGVTVPAGSVVTVCPMSAYNDLDSLCVEQEIPYTQARILLCDWFEIIYSPETGLSDDLHDVIYIDHLDFTELPEYFEKNNIQVG